MVAASPDFSFQPSIPSKRLGELKDMAQAVVIASATLEGKSALPDKQPQRLGTGSGFSTATPPI